MRRSPSFLLAFSVAFSLSLPLSPSPAMAVDGDLDLSFSGDGSTVWEIVQMFSAPDVRTNAVVPGNQELYLVGTRSSTDSHLAWRAYDPEGEEIDGLECEESTSQVFPFGVESRGLAAGLSDSGQLLVAGGITFQGSESTERAFIARFNRVTGGCNLDTTFASGGFAFFDDFSFCDTESCSALGLAQIRRPTLAVSATRIILLVRSEVSGPKGRLFLVGLKATGEVDNGFDGNGVLEILAPGTDGFYGAAHLELDARGRIYVLATPFKEGGVTDTDLYLFRYLPGGGLDSSFSGDGVLPVVESNSTDSTAVDLRIASDGTILLSGGTIGGTVSLVRGISSDGTAGATLAESMLPSRIAVQGNGLMVTSAEFLPESGIDGMRTRRRQFGSTGSFPVDPSWGTAGTADHDFDYDPGSVEGDLPEHLELWSGRPVIVGRSSADTPAQITFAMRLESRYIFVDGFEQGRAALWSAVTP
ncbi:MAG: hypothetical protein ABI639_06380 [Thermoanaerobaculia bacterium]